MDLPSLLDDAADLRRRFFFEIRFGKEAVAPWNVVGPAFDEHAILQAQFFGLGSRSVDGGQVLRDANQKPARQRGPDFKYRDDQDLPVWLHSLILG